MIVMTYGMRAVFHVRVQHITTRVTCTTFRDIQSVLSEKAILRIDSFFSLTQFVVTRIQKKPRLKK